MRLRTIASGLLLWFLVAWATLATTWAAAPPESAPPGAAAAEEATKYLRLERDEADEPLALQTAIVHFVAGDATQSELAVDLIAAIHVGDKTYYEALNKQFAGYDVVLYEMIAPTDAKIPKGAKSGNHPVAMLQNGLKDMLELEHQLELVDYTRDNMVHADMSPEDFAKSMKDRGENFMTMIFRMMGQAMAQQGKPKAKNKGNDIDLLAALFDKDRAGTLKRVLAEQFESMDGMLEAISGPQGSTIITERNKVALGKLGEQAAAGKKKIAIFYGAGHMGDLEEHLLADFHLKRGSQQWLTAWKLDKTPEAAKAEVKKPAASFVPKRWDSSSLALIAGLFGAH